MGDVAAYKTICGGDVSGKVRELLEGGRVDFVTFTSASTVRGFTGATAGFSFDRAGFTAICIGEETAAEADGSGYRTVISQEATIESMIEKIAKECGK